MTINDSLLDHFHYVDGWKGSLHFEAFGGVLEVHINSSESFPPSKDENDILIDFRDNQYELRNAVELAVFDYYCSTKELHRNWYGSPEEALKAVPDLTASQDIWKQIDMPTIYIEYSVDDLIEMTLDFNVSWDKEHGMSVTFYDGKIGVGEGGINWLDSDHYDLSGERIKE